MFKFLIWFGLILASAAAFLSSGSRVMAVEPKQVTIVNPIRGQDFWENDYSILETPRKEYELIAKNNLPATWLIRYDALTSAEVVKFLRELNSNQEVGLFLEVTPSFAKDAGVSYNKSPNWHYAKSVLLIGYSVEDRKRLIDTAIKKYQEVLGVSPKSVGAWWIDAGSLGYLHQKYGVMTNMDVADQYSTDQYQVWGQYFSLPFYPSKTNALLTAQSEREKIGVVTIQWAIRDPYNSYGNGVGDSTYSVQSNDYLLHGLDTNYFKKLLDVYPQVTVGLENDFEWGKYQQEYQNQIDLISRSRGAGSVRAVSMDQFGEYYRSKNPALSPNVLLQANDPLGGDGKVIWYQTPKYRVGWFYRPGFGVAIRDLRIYDESSREECLEVACNSLDLEKSFLSAIDDVSYKNGWQIDEGGISDLKVSSAGEVVAISYKNQAGVNRSVRFLANDIEVNSKVFTLSSAILNHQSIEKTKVSGGKDNYSLVGPSQVIISQLINLAKFGLFSLVFFVLPGLVLSRGWLLAVPVGWTLFTVVSFGLGYLKMEVAIWILPVLAMIGGGLTRVDRALKWPRLERSDWPMLGLVIVGSLSWWLTVVKNGLEYGYGLGFWGPNGHDAIWHLSLISQLQQQVPPQNPILAGEALTNYHYFFDLLIARVGALSGISAADLLFRDFSLVLAILVGLLVYRLSEGMFGKVAGWWAVFFVYFGGSWGWLVSFIRDRSFGGESMFWSQQGISTLLNPPFAISVAIFLTGCLLLVGWFEHQGRVKWWQWVSLVLIFGSLIEFKVYGGVLGLCGLAVIAVYQLMKRRVGLMGVLVGSVGLALGVFLPNNANSSSLIVWSPFWLVNSMMDFSDRVGWQRLSLSRDSGNWFKFFGAESIGLLIFILGNLGTRLIMVVKAGQLIRQSIKQEILMFLVTVMVVGVVLPLLFIQKGTNWNIVQFFYYFLLISNILAGAAVGWLWLKLGRPGRWVLGLTIVVLSLPTTINGLQNYLPERPPAMLPTSEIAALKFLEKQPPGVVMASGLEDIERFQFSEPVPLYGYTSTAYVSAFSHHPSFLEDTLNLEILGVDYRARLNEQRDFYRGMERSGQILERNNISYVYVLKINHFAIDEAKMGIRKIFENEDVAIYSRR